MEETETSTMEDVMDYTSSYSHLADALPLALEISGKENIRDKVNHKMPRLTGTGSKGNCEFLPKEPKNKQRSSPLTTSASTLSRYHTDDCESDPVEEYHLEGSKCYCCSSSSLFQNLGLSCKNPQGSKYQHLENFDKLGIGEEKEEKLQNKTPESIEVMLMFKGRQKRTTLNYLTICELKSFVYFKYPDARKALTLSHPSPKLSNNNNSVYTVMFMLHRGSQNFVLSSDQDVENLREYDLVEVLIME